MSKRGQGTEVRRITSHKDQRARLHLKRTPMAMGCVLFMAMLSEQALADCAPALPAAGTTVTCTNPTVLGNPFGSSVNNLTVNVLPNAQVASGLGIGTALSLTGNSITLNNQGTVDPSLL